MKKIEKIMMIDFHSMLLQDLCFSVLFLRSPLFFLSFFLLVTERDEKLVFKQKQMISSSERHAKHLFAGQSTQQVEL